MSRATFPDGVCIDDLQAAIQAAWLCDDFTLVIELAKRYGLYDKVCLRCVNAPLGSTIPPSTEIARRLGDVYYQLCTNCFWHEVRGDRTNRALSEERRRQVTLVSIEQPE